MYVSLSSLPTVVINLSTMYLTHVHLICAYHRAIHTLTHGQNQGRCNRVGHRTGSLNGGMYAGER